MEQALYNEVTSRYHKGLTDSGFHPESIEPRNTNVYTPQYIYCYYSGSSEEDYRFTLHTL